jgi:(E)-4-hydroxy-3-methylbut-2-enyl-diphosphate synthase
VQGEESPGQSLRIAYNILQAAGVRIFKTDYVACPSCGRTLFNLQETTARIKAATSHLKGVKIAIMGCIVNGPGEMADADFGYVGGAPGKVNLYVGKTPVKFNIPPSRSRRPPRRPHPRTWPLDRAGGCGLIEQIKRRCISGGQ